MIRLRGDPHRDSVARKNLAAQQAELLSALLDRGAPPSGFDPGRLRVQSDALVSKRRRVVTRLRPELSELGERLPELFESYARSNPRRTGMSAGADAESFVEWLQDQGILDRPMLWWWGRFLRWMRT